MEIIEHFKHITDFQKISTLTKKIRGRSKSDGTDAGPKRASVGQGANQVDESQIYT